MSKLYIVPTPIGNLDDMTNRAVQVLSECDLILAEDTRHTQKLLNAFDIRTKLISYHKFNEKKRSEEIVAEILSEDKDVALVTDAGTPCISDPGYELVKLARENNIEVIGLAGACAAAVALSVSGINTDTFAFYGFLPRKTGELNGYLQKIKNNIIKTFIIYESPKRIIDTVEAIKNNMPNATLCVVKELTKIHETVTYGSVSDVILRLRENSDSERGEYVIVGYNNDYEEVSEGFDVSVHALLFDKIYSQGCSMKEAVKQLVDEKKTTKNIAYKASLELKEFLEKDN